MGLETGTYLNDLNTANPDGASDLKSGGDNHLRLIKSVLKSTFPGLAGQVWRNQSKSGNYTLTATDNMTTITLTAAATVSGTAASLGNGFVVAVYNNHTAANTVCGTALQAYSGALVFSNGSTWLWFQLVTNSQGLSVSSVNASGNITSTGGNITATVGTISTSANQIVATKNSQTSFSTAGVMSQSTSGNAGLSLHAVGNTAAYIQHVRGGSGIQVYDAGGAWAPVTASQFLVNNQYGLSSGTVSVAAYTYLQNTGAYTYLTFDNTDFFVWEQSTNTLTLAIGGAGKIIQSASGIYPTTDNTLGCGVASNRWAAIYSAIGTIQTSDKREKDHIERVGDAGSAIDALEPVRFSWKGTGRVDLGFYAQDVLDVVPEAVHRPEHDDERWGLQPDRLIPLLVAEIQSLRKRVAELESR